MRPWTLSGPGAKPGVTAGALVISCNPAAGSDRLTGESIVDQPGTTHAHDLLVRHLWCRMGGPLPDDVDPSQAELLRIDARYEGADAIITVAGELDHSTAARFLACIREALDTQPRSIVVDGHGLTFTDSSGLAALLRARGVAQEAGVAFRVSSPSPKLRRFVELTGTKDYLL